MNVDRYQAPQDEMSTPIDVQAQVDFHRFTFAQTRGKRLSVEW